MSNLRDEEIILISFSILNPASLAECGNVAHVWLCKSAVCDELALEELRKSVGVTMFDAIEDDPLSSLLSILPMIIEHHPSAKISFFAGQVINSLHR